MKNKFLCVLVGSDDENYYKHPRNIRVILILGMAMYGLFGLLDLFMLPQTYKIAWIIRYAVIFPLSLVFYLFTYNRYFYRYGKLLLTILAVVAQLGIVAMMALANPSEAAYTEYYAGLMIVNLWSVIIFRLSINEVLIVSVTNIIIYNYVALFVQKLQMTPVHSREFSYLVSNNFFLVSASFLAILAAFRINKYKKKLHTHNKIIVEKKQLYEALKKAEESDQLKSAFLANMSHEIRTPMNAILGFGELLKKPALPKQKRDEYIQIIQSKGQQLLHLINDIIDLSRIEANFITIRPEPLNLNQLFDELSVNYTRILNDIKYNSVDFHIHKALPEEKSWIMADPNRLRQVLSNLLDNALKFTLEGEILTGYELSDEKMLTFYVKDTGIGIPYDQQSLIFDRFRQVQDTVHRNSGGTGLGLSIVKSLVELTGGKVWVTSVPKKGSEFYFTYPFKQVAANTTTMQGASGQDFQARWKGKTILLAEDNEDNCYYLEELLRETEARVIRANNGTQTVDIALSSDNIDLILMDIKMPEMNGYEAALKIKAIKNHLPIIAQTACAMEEDRRKALEAKCNDYISKPIEKEQLFKIISKYLN